jgi:hypothetical protein
VSDTLVQFALSVFGGAIGAAVTYWFWLRQQIQEIRRAYDQEVHSARMTAYAGLWKEFQPLAVYAPDEDVSYARIRILGVALRTWYFGQGGLLLTERARDAYFLVQDAIDRVGEQDPAEELVRPSATHWTRTRLDEARARLHLAPLYGAGASAAARATWHDTIAATIGGWSFGVAPNDDFVLLQFLASSLRTLLARDIRARDPSMLDE